MEDIINRSKQLQEELVRHRRWLHQHPEVGFDLIQTKEYVRKELMALGLEPRDCGTCGLIADIAGKPGKTFLLRADMDALPIPEEADVEFAAENGHMHACGHDFHTAMLLGAAKLLTENRQALQGTVRLMFQSAEEIFSGAKDMIAGGALEGVDSAAMIHVATATPMPTGTVIVAPAGVSAPAAAYFTIRVQGEGCHGAAPHKGVDALTAACHILIALQEIPARELPSTLGAVLTIGRLKAGTADNAIAGSATLGGTLRAFEKETVEFLKARLEAISRGIAASFRCDAAVEFSRSCPPLVNDPELCEKAFKILSPRLGADRVLNASALDRSAAGGSEDFAYVSQEVPAVMLSLSAGSATEGYTQPLHHPKVTFDEGALWVGAAALTILAVESLQDQTCIG